MTWNTRADEAADATALTAPPFAWWQWALLVVAIAAALAALIWAIVRWRRGRRAVGSPARTGPSLASRLPALWRPYYLRIPARALHYPTVVVMGAAGAGKTHAIACHVDWRGQVNQFRGSVHHDAALQLYLGPDVVIHEVSAPLLRDVSRGVRWALWRMWRRMGVRATVVLVVDARTLLTTPAEALRELAQLVRGKISLFPRRCRASLEVRVLLSHVDQIEGYEGFAAALGSDHEPLDLEQLGPALVDAERLVAAFDSYLAYALTTRNGDDFDRVVHFYGALRELLTGLRPLLLTLQGGDEPHAEPLRAGGLYLGSLAPRSHVGKPFRIAEDLISASLDRHRKRGLRGALAVLLGGSALLGTLLYWHRTQIVQAEEYLKEFQKHAPRPTRSVVGCSVDRRDQGQSASPVARGTEQEAVQRRAAEDQATAIKAFKDSENLWLAHTYVERKRAIEERFEETIREAYLYPKIPQSDRVRLHYLMALIYSSRDNELGAIINRNSALWARELDLSDWIVTRYVDASSSDMTDVIPEVPGHFECETFLRSGREWSTYLEGLKQKLGRATISHAESEELMNPPQLRSLHDYQTLREVSEALDDMNVLRGPFQEQLVNQRIDLWAAEQHHVLMDLAQTMREQLRGVQVDTRGWGLADLVAALASEPPGIDRDFSIVVDEEPVQVQGAQLSALLKRSHSQVIVNEVLDELEKRGSDEGKIFFGASEELPAAGAVSGYGGGPTAIIRGYYTRLGFERRVEPVLQFAAQKLAPAPGGEDAVEDPPGGQLLAKDDAKRLDRVIRGALQAYATAYGRELHEYYQSMSLGPTSSLTLPFVFKEFSRPSSWFTDYLVAVTSNADLDLRPDDPYHELLVENLAGFEPLIDLLAEKDGAIPGLEPYYALLVKLMPALTGTAESRSGTELHKRLTPIGNLTLSALQTLGADPEEQVVQLLTDSGLGPEWHAPFLAPVYEARLLGITNIDFEVERAWQDEVRPLLRPLLEAYPFNPSANVDVDVEDLDALVRKQGKDPGAFWAAFDRLIAPATVRVVGERMMLDELRAPAGMLETVHDLERLSGVLWDAEGERVPLKVTLAPLELPKEPHEDRVASMSDLSSGSAAVYGFNQRPEPQVLALQWWKQGTSAISVEMSRVVGAADRRTYKIEESGAFSFFRLLDRAENARFTGPRLTLTAAAISRGKRCSAGEVRGSKPVTVHWDVPVGEASKADLAVRMVLQSDPWLAFAVRDCSL